MSEARETLLAGIQLLVVDCDGVLTNGEIVYDQQGGRELAFYTRDGLGLALLCRNGVEVAVVSGRPVDVAEQRHRELGVNHFVGRCIDKGACVRDLRQQLGLSREACAFVGDDLVDLSGFAACGLGIAVADAAAEVQAAAGWVTTASGGRGAVREVCEAILKAQGKWDRIVRKLGS